MTTFEGADISHYQNEKGPIDFVKLREASTASYFACKATQRAGYFDPYCNFNRDQAHKNFFQYIGLYHWLSPINQASIGKQVSWYLSKISPLEVGEFAMLDAEEAGITEPQALEWCERVEDSTQRPVAVYSGVYVAGGSIWNSQRIFNGLRPRHLAAYVSEVKAKRLAKTWDFWQYSSNGPVPGIVGRCDMNRIDNDKILRAICGIKSSVKIIDTNNPKEIMDIYMQVMEPWKGLPAGQLYIQCDNGSLRPLDPNEYNMRKQPQANAQISADQADFYGWYKDGI